MQNLENDNLGDVIAENKKVFVQYGASWCGVCRVMKPKIEKLSDNFSDIHFVYADAEKLPGTRKFAEVANLPTYATFVDGKLVNQTIGSKIENVEELINEIASN